MCHLMLLLCCLVLTFEKLKSVLTLLENTSGLWQVGPFFSLGKGSASQGKHCQSWWMQGTLPAQEGSGQYRSWNSAAQGLFRTIRSEMAQSKEVLCQNPLVEGANWGCHFQVWKFEWVLELLGQILLPWFLVDRCYSRSTSLFNVITWVVSLGWWSGKLLLQLAFVQDST